ncbi:MAG: AtpZ/AtpI family protein [Kiloniellales bacterium]
MTDPEERPSLKDPSLKDLDARLKAARKTQAEAAGAGRKQSAAVGSSGMGVGFRLAIEMVTGIVVGVVVGLLLDRWLGTLPLFLVVFFLLGSAAGFLNVYRVASGQGYAVGYRKQRTTGKDEADGDAADGEGTGSGT